ncbi:oocyte zinc finger protein XlCOF6 [Ceratitis capitata]|uniref:Zinc finger protein 652-A n=1 Tax=Ceratitis capitata TaxID=7213 RepID=W8CCF3_CERCA|nr:oocyte zinc finger protein XlCOF6 [Ceratitis capitata]
MQCRACLQSNCNILIEMDVLVSQEGETLYDYFNACTQLHTSACDGLPKTLCKNCTQKLHMAYDFRKCALQSNEELKSLLQLPHIKSGLNRESSNSMFVENQSADPLEMKFNDALKALKSPERVDVASTDIRNEVKLEIMIPDDSCNSELLLEDMTAENSSESEIVSDNSSSADSVQSESNLDVERQVYNDKSIKIKVVNQLDYMADEISNSEYENCSTEIFSEVTTLNRKPSAEKEIFTEEFEGQAEYLDSYSEAFTHYKCEYCSDAFQSDIELQNHMKRHIFKCTDCPKICIGAGYYYKHLKRLHHKEVPAKQVLIEGAERRDNERIYCKLCNISYSTVSHYRRHAVKRHGFDSSVKNSKNQFENKSMVNNIPTQINQKINANRDKERQIELTETAMEEEADSPKPKEKENYLCSFCPRVLSSKRGLMKHEATLHLNVQPELNQCSFCGKNFLKAYLRRHIEVVHKAERKFACDICGSTFKTKDVVTRHRLLHNTKDYNFVCTVCDKRFTEKSVLKVHMRLHTGEMPFSCHICDKRFRIRGHLTYHLKLHDNAKLKCEVCGKEFKHPKSLHNHLYVHSGVMPYTCTICGYGSPKREYFMKHMLHKHEKEMTARELFEMYKSNTGRPPHVKGVLNIELLTENSQDGGISK